MNPAQVLLAAAEELRTHGWCQSDFADGAGRHCTPGAINVVAQGVNTYAASELLRNHLEIDWIDDWNDTPGRTADEVIAALEAAAHG